MVLIEANKQTNSEDKKCLSTKETIEKNIAVKCGGFLKSAILLAVSLDIHIEIKIEIHKYVLVMMI